MINNNLETSEVNTTTNNIENKQNYYEPLRKLSERTKTAEIEQIEKHSNNEEHLHTTESNKRKREEKTEKKHVEEPFNDVPLHVKKNRKQRKALAEENSADETENNDTEDSQELLNTELQTSANKKEKKITKKLEKRTLDGINN